MKHSLIVWLAAASIVAAACGGGDKAAEPTKRPAPTPEATLPKAEATVAVAEPTEGASTRASDGAGTVSSVFSSLFQGGTSGGSTLRGAGGGDESLKAYLPSEDDFPSDYTPFGSFTYSTPAGSSDLGAMDMAMTMAMKGDPSTFGSVDDPSQLDFSSLEMMIAAVIRPEDLQSLGDAFADMTGMSPESIEDEINSAIGDIEGFEVTRFEVLDASGLGDGGFGMEMTIDMSGLAEMLGALGAGEDAPGLEAMTMRMYVFARGDYMGAVMRIGFSDGLGDGAADLDLAKTIDEKLKVAPGA
ncbi:MAG TPA: hypothetical protein VJP07_05880 [Dehalococcoidia bacterium]|nr:hypothetical protein [Dehalococcoidia bacterium]